MINLMTHTLANMKCSLSLSVHFVTERLVYDVNVQCGLDKSTPPLLFPFSFPLFSSYKPHLLLSEGISLTAIIWKR